MNQEDRRWAERHPLSLHVELHLGDPPANVVIRAKTQNISFDGVALQAPVELCEYNEITLVFPACPTPRSTPRYIAVQPIRDDPQGSGLMFKHSHTDSIRFLRELLQEELAAEWRFDAQMSKG